MKGRVLGCDSVGGAISTEAGERFKFVAAEWKGTRPLQPGDEVDFVGSDGAAVEIYPAPVMSTAAAPASGFEPLAPETALFPSPRQTRRKIGPFRAVGLALWNFRELRGRSCRAEYWWFICIVLALEIAAVGYYFFHCYQIGEVCQNAAGSEDNTAIQTCINQRVGDFAHAYISMAGKLLGIVVVPSIALAVRRLHDTGRSGWRIFWAIVPFGVIPLLFWYAQRGNSGPNKYGPDPLIATSI